MLFSLSTTEFFYISEKFAYERKFFTGGFKLNRPHWAFDNVKLKQVMMEREAKLHDFLMDNRSKEYAIVDESFKIPVSFVDDLRKIGTIFGVGEDTNFDIVYNRLPDYLKYSTTDRRMYTLKGDRNAMNSKLIILKDDYEFPNFLQLSLLILERLVRCADEGACKRYFL